MAVTPKIRFIDRKEVLSRIPVSFPTLWSWMRAGTFPRSHAIGSRSVWFEHEVENWILPSSRNSPRNGIGRDEISAAEIRLDGCWGLFGIEAGNETRRVKSGAVSDTGNQSYD
jgi:predicted DNA-binding transcriptional regulator AlpA